MTYPMFDSVRELKDLDHSTEVRLRFLLSGDLNFHGEKTNHSVYSWHPFPAKFPPQLPRIFITNLTRPGDIVLDPMMGSCTTLIEALSLGREAWGCDIDPLSLRLGRAKLQTFDKGIAYIRGKKVLSKAQDSFLHRRPALKDALHKRFDAKTKEFIDYWFSEVAQLELLSLALEIESVAEPSLRDFFTLVFSGIIIAKSGGVSFARDLAHTRPHKVKKKPISALLEFRKRLEKNLQAVRQPADKQFKIVESDAKGLPFPEESVDLIITSPPYASNAIDYMRAHKFSLVWFGHSIDKLSKLRKEFIGGETVSTPDLLPLPQFAFSKVDLLAGKDKKKAKVLHRYYSEMTKVIGEIHRVLKPGRPAILVVGSSTMRGIDVETHVCLAEIGHSVGFSVVGIGLRRLDRDKRMLPARWRTNSNTGIESRIHEEFVIGFLKDSKL